MATSAMYARALALLALVVFTQSLTMDEGESNICLAERQSVSMKKLSMILSSRSINIELFLQCRILVIFHSLSPIDVIGQLLFLFISTVPNINNTNL